MSLINPDMSSDSDISTAGLNFSLALISNETFRAKDLANRSPKARVRRRCLAEVGGVTSAWGGGPKFGGAVTFRDRLPAISVHVCGHKTSQDNDKTSSRSE
ncbi:hypothetical protein Bbelb_005800 [Branchiostoma belcheri]|nr:hypothetical protein Bbelb_005800 [Branchiostoma belcheri]